MNLTEPVKEQRIKQSKGWRKQLDEILQDMKDQQARERVAREQHESGRHLALSITHLEDAIMRQGMRCKELDAPDPYPDSRNPESAHVEPTADGLKL